MTGGAGFIGSHVLRRLLDIGYKVVCVDNFNSYYSPKLKQARINIFLGDKKFPVYKIDIADYKKLAVVFKKHKIDIVCHLAAQAGVPYSMKKPLIYGQTNVIGTLNVLELARQYKVKNMVFASTSSVYGANDTLPSRENLQIDKPLSLYAATKLADEHMAFAYSSLYGIPITGLRFFNVYGPWGRPDSALYKFTRLISKGKTIPVYNYGKSKKDYTYVEDIADGVVQALKRPRKFEIFNLGNGRGIFLKRYISLIEKNVGRKAKQKLLPAVPGDVQESRASITKARKMLKYNPQTPVEEGIKKFVKWYKEHEKIADVS